MSLVQVKYYMSLSFIISVADKCILEPNTCQNGGVCSFFVSSATYSCSCPVGTQGFHCETSKSDETDTIGVLPFIIFPLIELSETIVNLRCFLWLNFAFTF